MKFNEAQLAAINADNRKILVSAGAGAGKSGALTERIIRLIEEGKADLLQMLVITFTKDAAASIRGKIRKALTEKANDNHDNLNLGKSVQSLPASHISTIHSFCSDVVRQGASFLGIDDTFKIIDDGMKKKVFVQAVTNAVEAISKGTYPKEKKSYFGAFTRAIKPDKMNDLCATVYDVLMGIPDPFKKLQEVTDRLTSPNNQWEEELFKYHKLVLLANEKFMDDLSEIHSNPLFTEKYRDVCQQDIEALKKFLEKAKKATTMEQLISAIDETAAGLPSIRRPNGMSPSEEAVYEQFKFIHGHLKNKPGPDDKNTLLASKAVFEKVLSTNPIDIRKTQAQITGLNILLEEVQNQYAALKAKDSVLDYSDLEQYAYQLLTDKENPSIRDYVRSTYKYVFVDECQDVSAIQHAIINALDSGENNLFYVGDIKQSIYRFRHADPLQFVAMRNEYSEDEHAERRKIYFQYNYRSTAAIIDGVNLVFSGLFNKAYTEIDYEPGDHLLVGSEKYTDIPNEIILINGDKPAEEDAPIVDPLEAQCVEIGSRIKDLVASGVDYKDIVILNRSVNAVGQKIVDYFTAMHIPCYFNGKNSFFDTPEVSLFIEILKTINNDHQDYPLLATLRSDLFGFTDAELAEIRIPYMDRKYTFSDAFRACAEKNDTPVNQHCHEALETIKCWAREAAEIHKSSDVIWNMLKKTNYYAKQSAFPDGEIRQKNLDAFYDKALSYESLGNYRLCDFLEQVDALRKASGRGSMDPVPMTDNDDFVRVMSIHASKGLEFPVVFIMDMHKNIHKRNNQSLQIHIETENEYKSSLGVYMPCSSCAGKHKTEHDTYGKEAFRVKKVMRNIAEESRLLYVAMTRAMHRLYMVGVVKQENTENWYIKNAAYRTLNLRSMLDMVMPAVIDGKALDHVGDIIKTPVWNVCYVDPKPIEIDSGVTSKVIYPTLKNDIDFDAEWKKTEESKTNIPSKTAVTYIISESFVDLDEETGVPADDMINAITLSDELEKPEFIGGKATVPEGAELGTLAHRLMKILPFDLYKEMEDDNVREELVKYIERTSVFSDKQAEKIIKTLSDGIAKFIVSPLGRYACENARSLLREQDIVYRTEVNGYKLLVQGVVDLMYKDTDGSWIIVDYKSDYDSAPDSMISKHGEQLNYYRHAIEKINKEPVSKMYLVSVRSGETVEVPKTPVKYA